MLLGLSRASPQAAPIRVELDAPAGCADVEAFYASVLGRTDRAGIDQYGGSYSLDGTMVLDTSRENALIETNGVTA